MDYETHVAECYEKQMKEKDLTIIHRVLQDMEDAEVELPDTPLNIVQTYEAKVKSNGIAALLVHCAGYDPDFDGFDTVSNDEVYRALQAWLESWEELGNPGLWGSL